MQPHSKFGLVALFCISLKWLERIFSTSHLYSETFIKTYSGLQPREISRETYPTKRSKLLYSALQHSLFWHYPNFSKLMRTIHISMTNTFQCEYCQCFTFKRCDKFKLKCTSHGGMASEKLYRNTLQALFNPLSPKNDRSVSKFSLWYQCFIKLNILVMRIKNMIHDKTPWVDTQTTSHYYF